HAVVSKLLAEYRPNNGGHGPLHDDFICRIKEFMEGTDELKSFKK
ncbi:3199_t:CDS:1, partial [Paraglomus occultum]